MSFKFNLATLLRVRESIEKREETALQAIQAEIGRLRRTVEILDSEIGRSYKALEALMGHPLEAREMQLTLSEINRKNEMRQEVLLQIDACQQKQKEQLEAYRAAARGRQVLSEMRAQKRAEYDQRQERAQQKFLDDIFASRSQGR